MIKSWFSYILGIDLQNEVLVVFQTTYGREDHERQDILTCHIHPTQLDRFSLTVLKKDATKVNGQGDIITTTQFIKDGEIIVSSGGTFELGFFSSGETSTNRYVGIWYKKPSVITPVWVANRVAPVTNKSGVLKVIQSGLVVLVNDTNATVWSTNSSTTVQNPVALLLDTGNFVVRDVDDPNPENFLGQSFDYPSNTLLAGMKLGTDLETELERYLSSWRSNDDPAPGEHTYHCDPTGYPQDLMRKRPNVTFRAGPWNGLRWSGAPNMVNNSIIYFGLIMNSREINYNYKLVNKSVISTLVIKPFGKTMRIIWIEKTQSWVNYHSADADYCDTYKLLLRKPNVYVTPPFSAPARGAGGVFSN
ncbi:G-type lectin S-receptor-like serine/threonine-protein kinase At4g27290 [Nicotiana sylvestris]